MVAELSVVILNWRNAARTLRCVASIRDWSTIEPELVVVDNESTDRSRSALGDALDQAELICSETNLGYAGGNNLGILRALRTGSPFILLLNSDAEIAQPNLARLIARLRDNPDIGVLGPVLYERHQDGEQCHVGGRDIVRNALTRHAVKHDSLTRIPGYPLVDVDYVPGAVLLARRAVFEQIGLLDEQFFFSGEIADLCKRARDAGHRVCVDLEAEARHDAGETPQSLRDTLHVYYGLRNRLLYAKRHYPLERGKYLALWSKLCLVELGRAFAQARLGKARAILLAMAHGCTNRFGNQNAAFL